MTNVGLKCAWLVGSLLAGAAVAAPGEGWTQEAGEAGDEGVAEEGDGDGSGDDGEEGGGIGLSLGAGFSSMYMFRGKNLFADEDAGMNDQNGMVNFSAEYALGNFAVGYWNVHQVIGHNISQKMDEYTGSEHDLYVTYSDDLAGDLSWSAGLGLYVYPLANKVSDQIPYYLEPSAGLTWSGPVEVGLGVSYYRGMPEDMQSESYIYLHPVVTRGFELTDVLGLEVSAGFGYKIFDEEQARVEGQTTDDNAYDAVVTVGVPWSVMDNLTVTASANAGWSNFYGMDMTDELMEWGALNVSWDI